VLNPRLDTPQYSFKSNNKTVMAYILGLPCIDLLANDEVNWNLKLEYFRDAGNRACDVNGKRGELIDEFGMRNVVKIWKKVLAKEL